jgi:RNA-directed DNA polymerase
MAEQGFEMVRYADDFVVLCRTPEDAERALAVIRQWVQDNGLVLHPTKTRIVDERIDGFEFLGYHFDRGRKWPRAKSLAKLKDAIRSKTRRTNGCSLGVIITDVNRTLRGWFEYFKSPDRAGGSVGREDLAHPTLDPRPSPFGHSIMMLAGLMSRCTRPIEWA